MTGIETVDLAARVRFRDGQYIIELKLPELDIEIEARGVDLNELMRAMAVKCSMALVDRGYHVTPIDVEAAMISAFERAMHTN